MIFLDHNYKKKGKTFFLILFRNLFL